METIKKILDALFLITMVLYVLLAAVIVLGQTVSLFSLNGELCTWFMDTFLVPACAICSCTGLIAYVMSYIYRWNSND